MTTIAQHQANTKAALKMVSAAVEAETGITYRRLIQAAERLSGSHWNYKCVTFVDHYMDAVFGSNGWYPDIRQRFSPNLHKTDYTKILEN